MLGIVLDGGANAGDMDVDRPVEGLELAALDEIHQPLAVEDAAGVLGKGDEEVELMAGQRGAPARRP